MPSSSGTTAETTEPAGTFESTAAAEPEQPAASAEPSEPQHQTPQVGETVSPQTTQQQAGESSEDYVMPANTPPEMIDRPTTGVSHKDIHGPGQ